MRIEKAAAALRAAGITTKNAVQKWVVVANCNGPWAVDVATQEVR